MHWNWLSRELVNASSPECSTFINVPTAEGLDLDNPRDFKVPSNPSHSMIS